MSFYDHFTQQEKMPTKIGLNLVRRTDKNIFNTLKGLIKQKDISILEIGPGRGVFAEVCEKEGVEYIAIEVNPTLASNLEKHGFKVQITKVPPIPIKSNEFDIVYMNQVFEHMNNIEMAQELIEESYRVLKKGGILCIISPDYLMWKDEFFNLDYTHNYITTARRLKEIYYDNNLEIEYINYISGHFFGDLTTFLLSFVSRLFIRPKLIYPLTLGLVSKERIYKIRATLLRSFIIMGRKK